jgi:hypothetical protein
MAALEKGVSEDSSRNHENCSIGRRIHPVSLARAGILQLATQLAPRRQNCGEELPAVITIPAFSADGPSTERLPRLGDTIYPCAPLRTRSAMFRFQCPECGMGDLEVGPMAETEIHCVVCLEEHGRVIRVHCWEEEVDQARLREGLLAA